jgi:iron complex transport system permease protein
MKTRPFTALAILGSLSLLGLAFALVSGSVTVAPGDILRALAGQDGNAHQSLVLHLRLPRALAAFATGGLLAVAGALMQVLLRNPLADPYVLGISGGAATAALLAMLAGLSGAWISGSALVGALVSTALVFGLAQGRGPWTPTRLLLTGVVVASGWGALIGFLLATSPEQNLRGMLFWLMGDLSYARRAGWPLAVLAAGLALTLPLARGLNVLSRGDLQARALGENTRFLRYAVYCLASGMTAGAVAVAGSVGFVGLVVPHMLRLSIGNDYRLLLPAAALGGGTLLVVADTLARTALAPRQLPVGVITALIGVPLFLYLLNQERST